MLIAFLWIVQGIRAGLGMSRLPWLSDVTPIASQGAPLVSIIFAARDEAEKLPAAIETLLAQDYPRFEVIAVNDRSTDQTPAILHEFARTSRNLIVADIASLPPGWLGKPHALVAGFEKSRGDWLVFTDADVHFAPDVLRRAVALAAAAPVGSFDAAHFGRNARLLGNGGDFVFWSRLCFWQ